MYKIYTFKKHWKDKCFMNMQKAVKKYSFLWAFSIFVVVIILKILADWFSISKTLISEKYQIENVAIFIALNISTVT